MNKFFVFPCVDQDDEDDAYKGPVVTFASASNVSFVLFFPISQEYAKLINHVLKKEDNGADKQLLSVYQTMLDSWKAGDRYLAGIVMDIVNNGEEAILSPSLILCDSLGNVDAVLNVNFVHAVLLGAVVKKEIIVTNELLQKLIPDEDEDDEDDELEDMMEGGETEENPNKSKFPVDNNIINIAREIMSGKKPEPKDEENESNDADDSKDSGSEKDSK